MLVQPHSCLCILTAVWHAVVRLYAEATILHSMSRAAENAACFLIHAKGPGVQDTFVVWCFGCLLQGNVFPLYKGNFCASLGMRLAVAIEQFLLFSQLGLVDIGSA